MAHGVQVNGLKIKLLPALSKFQGVLSFISEPWRVEK
jgi:hypothetical protein